MEPDKIGYADRYNNSSCNPRNFLGTITAARPPNGQRRDRPSQKMWANLDPLQQSTTFKAGVRGADNQTTCTDQQGLFQAHLGVLYERTKSRMAMAAC